MTAVEIIGLDGPRIPSPDASIDTAVHEVSRVLRPRGALHFIEHGQSPDASGRSWQSRLDRLQQRMAGGCHLTCDIPAIVEASGVEMLELDTFYVKGVPKPYACSYLGVAQA